MASTASTSSRLDVKSTKLSCLDRLKALEGKMNEARKLNHKEVVAEDERKKLPKNWEQKRKRVEWEEETEKKKQECNEKGEDYEKVKLLEVGADDAEKRDRKKKKKNPDTGFADYEQSTYRQYQQLTRQMKPDANEYQRQKDKLGDRFYADANTLGLNEHKDSEDAIDRMVTDLEKQIDKRAKYSRRRAFDEDADNDYINDRNMKFNRKLERFYGQYTAEIKQNLERGTAV